MRLISVLLIALCACLTGCAGSIVPKLDGGKIVVNEDISENGKVVKQSSVELQQPQNPQGPASVRIQRDENGTVTVDTNTSATFDPTKAASHLGVLRLLYVPMILGALMTVGGVFAFFYLPGKKLGIVLGVTGICLIVLSYLLAQYALIFILLIGLAGLAFVIYLLWKHKILFQGNVETVSLVQAIKNKLSDADLEEIFHPTDGIAKQIQSPSTTKLVAEIKKNA